MKKLFKFGFCIVVFFIVCAVIGGLVNRPEQATDALPCGANPTPNQQWSCEKLGEAKHQQQQERNLGRYAERVAEQEQSQR